MTSVIGEIAVVAGDVAACQRIGFGARFRRRARRTLVVDERLDEKVDQVGGQRAQSELAHRVRAEVPRPLATRRHEPLGGLAYVVLRVRLGHAVRQHLRVCGRNVRYAVGRAADLHGARVRRG